MNQIEIAGRPVGPGHPTYVIAELSGNHHKSLERARQLIRAAAEAGADAAKLQTYTADTITIDARTEPFLLRGGSVWDGRYLHDLYAEASMPWEWQEELRDLATSLGLQLFSSPFDSTAVDFLERLDMPAYKVASPELVDLPLIQRIAATGKPLIISTGMGTAAEIGDALGAAQGAGGVALLRCNSSYPAVLEEMDLRTIPDMVQRWDVPVGLSDHTLSPATAIAAVSLGACIVEKHLTLTRDEPGPDQAFSLEPQELALMIQLLRDAEAALGGVRYGPSTSELVTLPFRRSLFVTAAVAAGEEFTPGNVRSIRPADGLAPKHIDDVLGHRASRAIPRGTPLSWELVD